MLRDYQKNLATQVRDKLLRLKVVYLMAEMRVGKTLIGLETANLCGFHNVLFVTKKKAIQSIVDDYKREQYSFKLKVTNYEQIKKLKPIYDFIITDEAHCFGQLGKPALRTKNLKNIVGNNYLLLLSGTPNPETFSQLYYQFWLSNHSPFPEKTFYKWAKTYVNVKTKMINGVQFNDYKKAKYKEIMNVIKDCIITYTQSEAGFKIDKIIEEIKEIPINPNINLLIKYLIKNKYYKMKDGEEIVCDTPVKLQSKIHQLCSGTIKTESGNYKILDTSKIDYIKQHYKNKKIAIFYKFIAEGQALKKAFPNCTANPKEFNESDDKIFICQISSGSMGIDLSSADVLIFYNIDFSFVQYWQARARLQSFQRTQPIIVNWLFTENGIEKKIYDIVLKKKTYTSYYFKRDYKWVS